MSHTQTSAQSAQTSKRGSSRNTRSTRKGADRKRSCAAAQQTADKPQAVEQQQPTIAPVQTPAPMSVERAMCILAAARDARKALRAWQSLAANAEPVSAAQQQAIADLADLRRDHKRIYTLASAQMRAGSTSTRTRAMGLAVVAATTSDNETTTDKRGNTSDLHTRAKCALGNALRKAGTKYYNTLAKKGVTRSDILAAVDGMNDNDLNGLRDGIGWQSAKLLSRATAAALAAAHK